jgi:hypothetical protein
MMALLRIQGFGLPIVQDEAPFNSVTSTMGLYIPPEEVEHTIMLLTNLWAGLGHISMDIFSPAKEKFKVAFRTTSKSNFTLITVEALTEYAGHKGVGVDTCQVSISIILPGTWLLLEDTNTTHNLCTLCKITTSPTPPPYPTMPTQEVPLAPLLQGRRSSTVKSLAFPSPGLLRNMKPSTATRPTMSAGRLPGQQKPKPNNNTWQTKRPTTLLVSLPTISATTSFPRSFQPGA